MYNIRSKKLVMKYISWVLKIIFWKSFLLLKYISWILKINFENPFQKSGNFKNSVSEVLENVFRKISLTGNLEAL